MDPHANLEEQRELAALILDNDADVGESDVLRLAELVLALDAWRRAGGFDPYAPRRELIAAARNVVGSAGEGRGRSAPRSRG